MSKVGESVLKGAQDALAYAKGQKSRAKTYKAKIPAKINVRSIRKGLHMTREQFADMFGFSVRTLEKWEQGVRIPEGPTRAYLFVIQSDPAVVKQALKKSQKS